MIYTDRPTFTPHWLDDALCTPGSHDNRHDGEADADRNRRIARAKTICGRCDVDHNRCLLNGQQIRGDGVFGGVLLDDGKTPRKHWKKAAA